MFVIASTGFISTAFCAGKNPAKSPESARINVASTRYFISTTVLVIICSSPMLFAKTRSTIQRAPIPNMKPERPANKVRRTDSSRNSFIIAISVAPIAFFMPISRLRSLTIMYIMLLTPITPVKSRQQPINKRKILKPLKNLENTLICSS